MFVRPNQFRNSKADIQMFYGSGVSSTNVGNDRAWTKPIGISQVYMMLIGGGGGGDGATNGGNSGNVTVWFGAAQNVPDNLVISPAAALTSAGLVGNNTTVSYRGSTLTTLLTATGGNTAGAANTADTAGTFGNSGFFQNVLGQTGQSSTNPITASATTFLSCGASDTTSSIQANYGYTLPNSASNGNFYLQPIIVGMANGNSTPRAVAVGCGGSVVSNYAGPGFVLIASW